MRCRGSRRFRRRLIRTGLSATVADPAALAAWLGAAGAPASVLQSGLPTKPDIRILVPEDASIPYGGFMARYAVAAIYEAIRKAGTSIVFVNTRAQAELMLQMLWNANEDNLPIAIYHGSLDREHRRRTEAMMAAGKIRSVVATAALELGIDWGDVDLVIQVAAPKGVSRLLQRVGRSNHRLDVPSRAYLVPANRFEALECQAALTAIDHGQLDGEAAKPRFARCGGAAHPELRVQRAGASRTRSSRRSAPRCLTLRWSAASSTACFNSPSMAAMCCAPTTATSVLSHCRMGATASPTRPRSAGTGRISASSSRRRGLK